MTPAEHASELLKAYDTADACAAELLCDRHPGDAVAFTVVEPDLSAYDVTYAELRERSERVAAVLRRLGVGAGDRVATLMGKSRDFVAVLLGIWRLGAVHVPLFTAFAPSGIGLRLRASGAKVVVADPDQRGKLDPSQDIPADAPWRVIVAGADGELAALLDAAEPGGAAARAGGDAAIVLLYTSGTTGDPKGVRVPLRALASFQIYMEYGLDVRPDDVFWNAADPGWAYGLYYAVLGPLACGRRSLLLHAPFSAELTYQVLDRFGVTNFAAAPTVYRAMRACPTAPPAGLRLRACSSAGEPLNPELVEWGERALGVGVRDHYGQTELGMAVANGWHPDVRRDVRPGSMGHPLPGWTVEVLQPDNDDIAPAGTQGRVAVDVAASPLMWFDGYAGAPERTAERFSPDRRWYYTGDAGSTDADGYFFFSSRDDDVIIMAGYRIGPFEIESVLVAHPDVVDCAVVGAPDELRGEVVEAHVVLRQGVTASDELAAQLQQLVKTRYAAHAYPRRVHFVDSLPKTPSGKMQRFLLRQQG